MRSRLPGLPHTKTSQLTLYFANATLGTPPQDVRLHIDTGSSDLWVNTPSSTLCEKKSQPCAASGTYAANSSSTYSYISSDFNITYVDGTGAVGDYVSDTVTVGGATLAKLQFGIGYSSSSSQDILGIGYLVNEVQAGRLGKPAYNNLPAQLVADNLIQSNAYSLWLNDLASSTGSILFGGVDTSQYQGSLQTIPIQKEAGEFAEFFITLTKLTLGNTTIVDDLALAVLLDSGSSLSYLPDSMTEAIYEAVGAQYDASSNSAYVPCSLASNTKTLDFTFSSPIISVSMAELVIPYSIGPSPDGTPACLFGIAPSGSSTSVLGDTFLRSAFVVYDLANNEISLAQTDFNATTSNVVEIGTGTSSVPGATVVANPVAATAGIAGGQVVGVITGSTNAAGPGPAAPAAMFSALMAIGAALFFTAM